VDSSGSDGGGTGNNTGGTAGNLDIQATNQISIGDIAANGGKSDGTNSSGFSTAGDGGAILLQSTNDSIIVSGDISSKGGTPVDAGGVAGNASTIDLQATSGSISLQGNVDAHTDGTIKDADITIASQILRINGLLAQTIQGLAVNITSTNTIQLGQSLTIDAGDGVDATINADIDYNGIVAGGALQVNAGNDVIINGNIADSDVVGSADTLAVTFNSNDDAGIAGDININGSIDTNGGSFTVTGVNYDATSDASNKYVINTGAGNAILTMDGSAALGEMDVGGDLTVSAAGGDITQGSANTDSDNLIVGGASSFTATGNNVILSDVDNDFTGSVGIAANRADITDANQLILGDILLQGASLDISNIVSAAAGGSGDILQANDTTVNNHNTDTITTLSANGNNITLNKVTASNVTNNFDNLRISNANNVSLAEDDAIRFDGIDVAGNLTLIAGYNSGSSATNVINDTDGTSNSVAGTMTLTARNIGSDLHNIRLNSTNNNFNTVNVIAANDVRINDGTGSIGIQGNISGFLDLQSAGTVGSGAVILNPGELNVSGSASFTVSDAQSIDLGNAANTFNNDPTFASSGTMDSIAVSDDTDITIQDNLNITGDLSVTGNNVAFRNTTIGGDLTATATEGSVVPPLTGTVTQQSGALSVAGAATLDGKTITLLNAGNDFQGAVIVNNSQADVTLRDDTGNIQLGDATNVFLANTLAIDANGGNITQGNTVGLVSDAVFDSGAGDVLLNTASNGFSGNVQITASRDASVTNGVDLTVSAANVTRDLSLQSDGSITMGVVTNTNINVGRNLVVNSGTGITESAAVTLGVVGETQLTARTTSTSRILILF